MSKISVPLCVLVLALFASRVLAGSAQWNSTPGSGDWNTAANWTPVTVPNSTADTATFATSTVTSVSLSATTQLNGIVFNGGASAYTITATSPLTLAISGVGITNNSGISQNFVVGVDSNGNSAAITFSNSATAGIQTVFTNEGSDTGFTNGGLIQFSNTATAGNATINNNGATAASATGASTTFFNTSTAGNATINNNQATVNGASGGFTEFRNSSTAGTATIINSGATVSGGGGSSANFLDTSSAGTATITNNGGTTSGAIGSETDFNSSSTASGATLIANGGTGGGGGATIFFFDNSTGGTARVEVFGNGSLDISLHNTPLTIGSIEGSGNVFLGSKNLSVGSNNLSTTFSGVIQDGASGGGGGTGGSLTKVGTGTLSLTNANTFTGGTLINVGTLIAGHDGALGTGNVSLTASGVTLTLQNGATNNYISNNASISIVNGATANLNYALGQTDIVGGIVLNGVTQTSAGTYGSTSSGATFKSAFFSGTGTLTLVPEPSTYAVFGTGTAVLFAVQRLRRKRR